jgi:hypothetical protein
MVEIGNPMGQFHRMVVREKVTKRAQMNPACPLERHRDKQVRSRTRFPGCRIVLAYPRLLETKCVKPLDLFEIPLLTISNGPFWRMRRHKKGAEFHAAVSSW